MAQGPCLNPNCKSQGRPHPNCRCYAAMADGGPVSHYCESCKPHLEGCEYFADGGVAFNPDEFLGTSQAPESQPAGGFNPDEFLKSPEADEYQQAKYGTGTQQAIAGVEAVARSATFGASSAAERALGVPDKDQLGREQANPGTAVAGTVAGLFVPGGEGAALEKLGSMAASHVIGEGILKGASRSAVKFATENALFQAGDETSKMILNDPNQTVSTAVANIGLAGLIGGAAGGLTGATGALWKSKIEPKASEIVNDFKARISELKGEPVEPVTPKVEVPPEVVPTETVPKTKTVYDPFTHAESKIESSIPDGAPRANIDPFTHKPIEPTSVEATTLSTTSPTTDAKPLADTLGGKLADFYVKRADDFGARALGGTIGGYIGHLTGVPGAGAIGAILGQKELGPLIEKILPSIAKSITERPASGSGLKAAVDYGMNVVKGEKLVNGALRNLFKSGPSIPDSKLPDEVSRQKLDKIVQVVKQDPTKAIAMAGDVGHYLPDHAASMGSQAMQAVNFISSLRPQTEPKAILDKPIAVSRAAKAQYDRVLDIADQPLMVLDAVKQGTLTSHDVIALQTLYPQLYNSLKTKVMGQLVEHVSKGESVPYDTRMGLSLFLGEPLDSTLQPQAIMAAQPQPEQSPDQGKVQKVSQKASSNLIKGSKSLQTASQASEAMHQGSKA